MSIFNLFKKKEISGEKSDKDGKPSYYVYLKSQSLPFSISGKSFANLEKANDTLQKFVRILEKKFDSLWYIGTDYLGDEMYERFVFQNGGFMEISLKGEIRCFLFEDKIEKMKDAIKTGVEKFSGSYKANQVFQEIKSGQRLISLENSLSFNK